MSHDSYVHDRKAEKHTLSENHAMLEHSQKNNMYIHVLTYLTQ